MSQSLFVNLRSEAKLIALIDCDDFYHQAGPIQTKRCCGRFTMNDMRNAVRVFTIIFLLLIVNTLTDQLPSSIYVAPVNHNLEQSSSDDTKPSCAERSPTN